MSTLAVRDAEGNVQQLTAGAAASGDLSVIGIDTPFGLAVNMGQLTGYTALDKFGVNLDISSGVADNDIWEFGGAYTYDADGTAPILYLSSSDNTDTQPIEVQGLDINGDLVSQTITLTGQTNASLTTALWRVFRMSNDGNAGDDIAGVVYCHTDAAPTAGVPASANVRAIINAGNNQTLMALYTVPKGQVGFLWRGEVGVSLEGNAASLSEYAHIHYESRRFGKVFRVKKSLTCMIGGGSAIYQDERSFKDIIPAMTDVRIRSKAVTADMGLFSTFDMLLVDEDNFSEAYLSAIGQPGY